MEFELCGATLSSTRYANKTLHFDESVPAAIYAYLLGSILKKMALRDVPPPIFLLVYTTIFFSLLLLAVCCSFVAVSEHLRPKQVSEDLEANLD